MLLQSQNDFIHILPALPDNWSNGSFNGLCVRGGAEVDATWVANKLTKISVTAQTDNIFKIMVPEYATKIIQGKKELSIDSGFISIEIKKGEVINMDILSL